MHRSPKLSFRFTLFPVTWLRLSWIIFFLIIAASSLLSNNLARNDSDRYNV